MLQYKGIVCNLIRLGLFIIYCTYFLGKSHSSTLRHFKRNGCVNQDSGSFMEWTAGQIIRYFASKKALLPTSREHSGFSCSYRIHHATGSNQCEGTTQIREAGARQSHL